MNNYNILYINVNKRTFQDIPTRCHKIYRLDVTRYTDWMSQDILTRCHKIYRLDVTRYTD
jgi:hypothetical protein